MDTKGNTMIERGNLAVVGVFSYLDDAIKAIKAAQNAKWEYRVYSPVPHHEIEETTMPHRSPIRYFTFFGGILGVTAGFTLAILCSLDYPMRVSSKDIVSVPGFFVIGYECMILFGAIFTLMALMHFCRLPNIFRSVGYDPRFSDDKFGVVVSCDKRVLDDVRAKMLGAGADEVEVREAL